jgi:hypothetical protein
MTALRRSMFVAVVLVAGAAGAAPKGADAKAQFDRGVAAYQKGDFAGASDALGKSYGLEPDVETLFAWAQTERKLEHCDKASELYSKLLDADIPAENKQAVREKFDECQKILAAAAPKEPVPVVVPPPPEPPHTAPLPPPRDDHRAWWKDPVGDALTGAGVIGLGVGTVFLVQAHAANHDKATAADYGEFQRLESRADSRGKIGIAAMIGGGVLLAGGIAWYVTHGDTGHHAAVTAWVAPDSGGVVALGRF